MSRILITGAAGQVGTSLIERSWAASQRVLAADRSALDIVDADQVQKFLRDVRPDYVINAAAYTAVDKAEEESALAYAVNRDGARNLAEGCRETGAILIHLSTDYVFDGAATTPYREDSPTAPQGVYGASKLAGEEAVRATLERHVILRLSWVFSEHGSNFLKTMLRLAASNAELRVVDDQQGCPTYAGHAAAAVAAVVARSVEQSEWGTFHFCDAPATTWHGFASEIVSCAREQHPVVTEKITPVTTAEFPTPAARPAYSVLDCSKLAASYGIRQHDWKDGIQTALSAIAA